MSKRLLPTSIRYVGEVVQLTRDCDIGKAKEKAVVVEIDGIYMKLVFPDRSSTMQEREVLTGADYLFLKEA